MSPSTSPAATVARDHAPGLETAFDRPPEEASYTIEEIEGAVPPFVRGSYYLNGPARFERGGTRARHWLDGDGMICALHFEEGGVEFSARYVRTHKLVAEEEAGRHLFRAFGTAFDGDRLRRGLSLESPGNVSIYPFAGTVLAFGEQGLPWRVDPRTLTTEGVHDFGKQLNEVSPFAAHPAFDYRSGEMFNFGISFSSQRPCLNLYRFSGSGELLYRRRLGLDLPVSIHDFGLSARHAVFYVNPYVLDPESLVDGGASLLEALSWRPEVASLLLVADRETGEEVCRVPIGSAYCLHLIECFETGEGLAVDVLELDRPVYDQYMVPDLFPDARTAQPVRYLVDVSSGRLLERREHPYRRMCDFPGIDPRRAATEYDEFWVLGIAASEEPGRKFFDELAHLSWNTGVDDVYRPPRGRYLGGEPVFIPDPGSERGGAILCQELDTVGPSGSFLLFDAHDVAGGPVARLRLRRPVHLGFHACFAAS
ncbi:MAG: carotenoid oxygenase family protein [Thermoanaerobaculia bacterium]